jgi:hypothetical protein
LNIKGGKKVGLDVQDSEGLFIGVFASPDNFVEGFGNYKTEEKKIIERRRNQGKGAKNLFLSTSMFITAKKKTTKKEKQSHTPPDRRRRPGNLELRSCTTSEEEGGKYFRQSHHFTRNKIAW